MLSHIISLTSTLHSRKFSNKIWSFSNCLVLTWSGSSQSVASASATLALALWPLVTLTSLILLNDAKQVSSQALHLQFLLLGVIHSSLFFILQFTSQGSFPEPPLFKVGLYHTICSYPKTCVCACVCVCMSICLLIHSLEYFLHNIYHVLTVLFPVSLA